jgi:putative endonuclease
MDRKSLGQLGERKAQEYLKSKGYAILDINFKRKWGELDIVAKKRKKFVFCEVKTIRQNQGFEPEDEVGWKKKQQLRKMAQIYLQERKIPLGSEQQIDILALEVDDKDKIVNIRHFENAVEDFF